ncbi:MAG: hypothetical protein DRJ05_02185 [Bacteroidetes bacterium]|nr:MAG: hypothetical protein DRJ05_02185 [Bacteroidota bacterium]
MSKKIFTTGLFTIFCLLVFSQEADTSKSSSGNIDDIEAQLQKIQDSLNTIKEQRLIETYSINVETSKNGKTLSDANLRSRPEKTSNIITMIARGTGIEVYNFLPDYMCWAVRYSDQLGFLGVEDVFITGSAATSGLKEGSEYDTKPKLKTYVKPKYPKEAKKDKIEGKVILKVFIEKSGEVSEVEVLKGIPELNEAAKQAALKYKFTPASFEGKPVGAWFPLGITFKL